MPFNDEYVRQGWVIQPDVIFVPIGSYPYGYSISLSSCGASRGSSSNMNLKPSLKD
jgi:hypothetical protein